VGSRVSRRLRIRVLERDGYRCVYCGRTSQETRLEVDHVLARSRGGTSAPDNLVSACTDCNGGKSAEPISLPSTYHAGELGAGPRRWTLRAGLAFDARFDRYRPFDFACDSCGRSADTVHFWPELPPSAILFACAWAACQPGGHAIAIPDLFAGPPDPRAPGRRWTGLDALRERPGGEQAASLLRVRLEQLRRGVA
jgi:hypothetical protein